MDFKYSVQLTRFRKGGKYYDDVSFGTNADHVYSIVDEIVKAIESNIISDSYDYLYTGMDSDGNDTLPSAMAFPHFIKADKT